jgi:PII-like signaling protein
VNQDCLKLTVYFGERDRVGRRFLADALVDVYARHELETSLVMRATHGFGAKQLLRTDRLLTLSEDLPLVSVAVDTRPRIETALAELAELPFDGLLTLERARMLTGPFERVELAQQLDEATKLTVYLGRQERAGGRPAHLAVVDLLHRQGIAGATVLLGVDGTARGVRRRARFFGRNAQVPLMVISIGDGGRIAAALPELGALLSRPLVTLERVRILKRDGVRLAEPRQPPGSDASGLEIWQKLMVYAGEQSRHGDEVLYTELVRRLRAAGAAGATSLRGVWGYHGDHRPHGDSFWRLRRRVPVVTVLVDRPERVRHWFAIVDELTSETGLVTSEIVPAMRVTGPGLRAGGLRLAAPG